MVNVVHIEVLQAFPSISSADSHASVQVMVIFSGRFFDKVGVAT
jgi:hypothetical protein